jgi:serine/threonine protein phosphatase PrpC
MKAAAISARRPSAIHLGPLQYTSAAATHPGCVRTVNEDACLDRSDIGLWAVADGMGGHEAGALASRRVVEKLSEVSSFDSAFAYRRAIQDALVEANASLRDEAAQGMLDTIGATVVTVIVHGGHYACLWAGDSRAYIWRAGRMRRLTRDHTLVEELVESGRMSSSDANARKYAHVVTRAVGARPKLDIECAYGLVQSGDRFLLCSDGLGTVDDALLERVIASGQVNQAAKELIQLALQQETRDNVTAIVIEACAS